MKYYFEGLFSPHLLWNNIIFNKLINIMFPFLGLLRGHLVHQDFQDQRYFLSHYIFYLVWILLVIFNEILNWNLSLQGNMGLNFQGPKGEKVSKEKNRLLNFMFSPFIVIWTCHFASCNWFCLHVILLSV